MTLTSPDFIVLALYIVLVFGVGILLSSRASRNTEEFFVSGRSLPWWIIGTSMVATTFAADTPLVVSGLVAKGGIYMNWIWWYWGIASTVTVFLFARLWKRAGVTTDVELIELRYDGKPAAALRFYRAGWFGFFQNVLVIAWVMKAMAKILLVVAGWDSGTVIFGLSAEVLTVLILFFIVVAYTAISGLWGVVMTDLLQFALAMGGSVYLAVISFRKLGGIAGITERLAASGADPGRIFQIIPERSPILAANPFTEFLILILVVWWASYSVDGGGYLSQRIFAAKNERHAVFGYLWFCVAHTALRPWPWIVVGLCALAWFGPVDDPERYYPMMMKEMLRPGIFGLVIASFFAAFMSTIDTQLNWGSSLIVNDILRRFLWKGKSEREYVRAARLSIIFLALLGALASFAVNDISLAWKLVVSVTAGIGSVYIARWYWWRVNAWSEIAAMATAMATTFIFALLGRRPGLEGAAWLAFPYSTALTAGLSIVVWIGATFLTRPVGEKNLARFYGKVRPGGVGWKKIYTSPLNGFEGKRLSIKGGLRSLSNILAGLVMTFGTLIGTGRLILGHTGSAIILFICVAASASVLFFTMRKSIGPATGIGDEVDAGTRSIPAWKGK
ncbi:MAG: Na+:solute symporter [Candidatus Krumholzibacteriota bacterium]|nr:Na+:solute symporter [Candidatus Krumholzibacteriota bacterium]